MDKIDMNYEINPMMDTYEVHIYSFQRFEKKAQINNTIRNIKKNHGDNMRKAFFHEVIDGRLSNIEFAKSVLYHTVDVGV